ncbi:unnamed protein product [Ilex paraguariensis]|uniref:Uncharacterized protein n=1 Tax=Ilex paraguariensis TaxID=185542 RepID=A0ABC8S7E5_9AQUA
MARREGSGYKGRMPESSHASHLKLPRNEMEFHKEDKDGDQRELDDVGQSYQGGSQVKSGAGDTSTRSSEIQTMVKLGVAPIIKGSVGGDASDDARRSELLGDTGKDGKGNTLGAGGARHDVLVGSTNRGKEGDALGIGGAKHDKLVAAPTETKRTTP